jgi:predicted DNA-binding transcriptional regulator YafY
VTAAEVAEELEISVRTARRDLEALAMAGIPVYSRPGRGGGWSLIGGARTDLTGLTGDEARALLLTVGSAASVPPSLRRAVGKLVQALPEPFRADADRVSEVTLVDDAAWGHRPSPGVPELLEPLQHAVLEQRRVELGYDGPGRGPTNRVIDPWGLVIKAGVWYLVAGTEAGERTFRADRVTAVRLLEQPADRPEGFDLARAWRAMTVKLHEERFPVTARGLARPSALGTLRHVFADRIQVGPVGADGRHPVEVEGESVVALAAQLAGFTGPVEIHEPAEVRRELAAIGRRLVALYGPGPASDSG